MSYAPDTSANLIYDNEEIADQALRALTLPFNGDLLPIFQLRSARSFPSKPTSELQVRIAAITDRKPPRAHERSRFYMMHPEHDPREQHRRDSTSRRGRSDRRPRRRRSYEDNAFPASMYDDDPNAGNSPHSYSADRNGASRSRRRSRSRSPNRSASPSSKRGNFRRRDRSPPRREIKASNRGKELFPTSLRTTATKNKAAAANIKRELFPHLMKSGGSTALHRRTNSIDATYDTTTDVLASNMAGAMSVPFVDGTADGNSKLRSDSLRQVASQTDNGDEGFSIRGAAGFSIRGSASKSEARVKELFPDKVNNRGKELFAGLRERKRADMFY